ncbi:MAG TPA: hypothetical protein VIW45_18080 [Vicinamibacterales bacterium]|jgi:two-component sensor histidine kinase
MNEPTREDEVIHRLKNHVAIIVGFTELLIAETPDEDPRKADLIEVHKAAQAAMALMPELGQRIARAAGGI